ncbi:MAG: YbbR-like domain-containing protein, partial [Candidatus Muiribacteriaceae bacterium]
EIVSITPDHIPVTLNDVHFTELDIKYQIRNKKNHYHKIIGDLPDRVKITGAKEKITQVFQARVTLDLERFGEGPISLKRTVEILDYDFREITDVRTSPETVTINVEQIRVPVMKKLVSPSVNGKPAPGYSVYSVEVDPFELDIQGRPEVLDKVDHVTTEPIDITGIDSSISRKVKAKTGADYDIAGQDEVQVTVIVNKDDEEGEK